MIHRHFYVMIICYEKIILFRGISQYSTEIAIYYSQEVIYTLFDMLINYR